MPTRNWKRQPHGADRAYEPESDHLGDVCMSDSQRALILRGVQSRIERLGLTQEVAIQQMGLTLKTIHNLRRHDHGTSSMTMQKIAAWLRSTRPA